MLIDYLSAAASAARGFRKTAVIATEVLCRVTAVACLRTCGLFLSRIFWIIFLASFRCRASSTSTRRSVACSRRITTARSTLSRRRKRVAARWSCSAGRRRIIDVHAVAGVCAITHKRNQRAADQATGKCPRIALFSRLNSAIAALWGLAAAVCAAQCS